MSVPIINHQYRRTRSSGITPETCFPGSLYPDNPVPRSPLSLLSMLPTLPILPQPYSLCALGDLCGHKPFMQNKPNFKIGKMTLTPYYKEHYGKMCPHSPRPKQTQSNPISSTHSAIRTTQYEFPRILTSQSGSGILTRAAQVGRWRPVFHYLARSGFLRKDRNETLCERPSGSHNRRKFGFWV